MFPNCLRFAAVSLALIAAPAAGQQLCDDVSSLAGTWRGSPVPASVCSFNVRPDGRLRVTSTCSVLQEQTGQRFSITVRGSILADADCSVRAVLRLQPPVPGAPEVTIRARGRVWGSGNGVPDAGVLVGTDDDMAWAMTMYRR